MSFSAYFKKKNKDRALNNIIRKGTIDCVEENTAYFNMLRSMDDLFEILFEAEEGLPSNYGDEKLLYSVRKTPFLFSDQDIYYLRQFPPTFWAQALSHRYNKMLADLHREYQLAQNEDRRPLIPEWDFVTLWDANRPCTFLVNILASQHYNRLTSNVDRDELEKISELEKTSKSKADEARKEYERKHGYYELELGPYVPGGHVREKDEEKEPTLEEFPNPIERTESWRDAEGRKKGPHKTSKESPPDRAWIFKGLVGMTRKRASIRLGGWVKSVSDGWLAGGPNSPKRQVFDDALKVDWRCIRGSGGRDRSYPLMVPVYSEKQIKQLNSIDNREYSNVLKTSVSDSYFQPTYIFPLKEEENYHPLWRTGKYKNYNELMQALKYEEREKTCLAEMEGQLKEVKVPCRVWKALTPQGVITEFIAPIPIMDRGLLIERGAYRAHESKQAAVDNIKSLSVTADDKTAADRVKNILKDLRLGVGKLEQKITQKNSQLATLLGSDKDIDDEKIEELRSEISQLKGSLEIARHLDTTSPNWSVLPDDQLIELVKGRGQYVKQLEQEAKGVILDAVERKLVADESDYVKHTLKIRKGPSLYHWINTGGASMNRGTKQYRHAPKEVTERYLRDHEKFFTQNDVDGSGLPKVAAYPFDPHYIEKLLKSQLESQKEALLRQTDKLKNIEKVLDAPRTYKDGELALADETTPENQKLPSLLQHVKMYHELTPLNQIQDIDDQKLHQLKLKRTAGSAAKKGAIERLRSRIEAFKGNEAVNKEQKFGLGAYNLLREYIQTKSRIRGIRRTIRSLQGQLEGIAKPGSVTVTSPIAEGVDNFMQRIKGSPEYDAMMVGINLLYESIKRYVVRNLGEESYGKFLKAEKEYQTAKSALDDVEKTGVEADILTKNKECEVSTQRLIRRLDQWKTCIRGMAFKYAKCMWQLDLGFGTRRQRERGLKGALSLDDEDNNEAERTVELTPSEQSLAKELENFVGANADGDNIDEYMRQLVTQIKDSVESRMEGEGETSTSMASQRGWLFQKIRGVNVADANWQQILEIGQTPEPKAQMKNKEDTEERGMQDFVHGLVADDMVTAAWMKVGGRAFQLVRLGFIQRYKEKFGRFPKNKEVQEYLERQKKILMDAVKNASDERRGDQGEMLPPENESETPEGHIVTTWAQIKDFNRSKANQLKKMLSDYTNEQWNEYRKNRASIGPLQKIYGLIEKTSLVAQQTRTRLVDLAFLESSVSSIIGRASSRPAEQGELLKTELKEFSSFYQSIIIREAPAFDLALTIIKNLQNEQSYKIVHADKVKKASTYWQDCRNNASAARRWIDAGIILQYKTIKVRFSDGTLKEWRLSKEDIDKIQAARVAATNRWKLGQAAKKFMQDNPGYDKKAGIYSNQPEPTPPKPKPIPSAEETPF